MNRILFFRHEIDKFIKLSDNSISKNSALKTNRIMLEVPFHDKRIQHIYKILHTSNNQRLKAGIVDESIGDLHVLDISNAQYQLDYKKTKDIVELQHPHIALHVILAHVRPPVMARVLRDVSGMQVASINVHLSELTEKSYINSSIWNKRDELLLEGMMQGSCIKMPTVTVAHSIGDVLTKTYANLDDKKNVIKIYCDMESDMPFIDTVQKLIREKLDVTDILLAIGPERGYTEREIELLNQDGFMGLHLGTHILRSEVAVHLGVGIVNALRGE